MLYVINKVKWDRFMLYVSNRVQWDCFMLYVINTVKWDCYILHESSKNFHMLLLDGEMCMFDLVCSYKPYEVVQKLMFQNKA